MTQKYGDPYKICNNCKGNGYVRIIPYSETQTCKQCGGAGHFEQAKRKLKSK
jgi:DnaJ-class molecular chaperone